MTTLEPHPIVLIVVFVTLSFGFVMCVVCCAYATYLHWFALVLLEPLDRVNRCRSEQRNVQ